MINESGTTLTPCKNASVDLVTVYRVHSDPRYDVIRNNREAGMVEVFRTISGQGTLELDDMPPVSVGGDTLVLIPSEVLRRYRCEGDGWRFWWFKFRNLHTIGLELQRVLTVEGALGDEVHCGQCLNLLREGTPEASSYASSILSFLLGKWAWQLNRTAIRLDPHRDGVSRVIDMMHRRLGDGLSVSTMANAACLSERRFRQVFESLMGASPKRYYDTLRLETAAQMLVTTSMSVAELAESLGYSSQFHFSRAFKAYFGKPPILYRG